jgi:hypothetical protein
MAGILDQIRRPGRQMVSDNAHASAIDIKALQLRAAMEILAEIFGTDRSDVKEMIQRRLEESCEAAKQGCLTDDGLWPREFRLTD